MNRPDRPCRMGPPSYVCWFRNPMNTIVIYVTWSPIVARCEFCAQIVARWPFWIVMWSPVVARCEFCAESGLPLWRCGHFGSLRGPSLRRSPRKLPTTRAQRCSCKQESFFLSFILLRIVWKWQWIGTETFGCFARQLFRVWHGTSTQVRVDDVDLLSASISQYRWRAQSCELASSRGDGQGGFCSSNLFVISAINHGIQPLITQLNAIDWGPHPVVFSTFLRTPRWRDAQLTNLASTQ